MAAHLLVLGVSIWVLIEEIFTVHIPFPITHRVRFHILHYVFQLTITLVSFVFNDCVLPGVDKNLSLGKGFGKDSYNLRAPDNIHWSVMMTDIVIRTS